MKQTPQMKAIQEAMRPGAIARDGFLGSDTRAPGDIIEADAAAVRRLGLTHGGIARRMRELEAAGGKGLGRPTHVPPHFEVTVDSVRGKLPCPFGHQGMYGKTTVTVKNLATSRQIMYTDLGIHMIEEHGFYEGIGAAFRCDPSELAAVLGIAPEEQTPATA
jgi:hypothetical protein